jgi:release factor glutamine methyltransferase
VNKEIQDIYKIQKVLEKNGYFDISRISKEIYKFSEERNIPLEIILKDIDSGKPWEYISGECVFCDSRFLLNEHTLIPRIETEDLVTICYEEFLRNRKYTNICDIGTGSGCVVISLCKKINSKDISFIGTDISKEAIDIAKKNSEINGTEKDINFVQTDLLGNIEIKDDTLLVANLPYIPTDMYNSLDSSVKDFEPKNALEGGDDGLEYYKELQNQLKENLNGKNNICLIVEIEPSTLEDFKTLFKDYALEVKKDFTDKERFVLIHLC